MTEMAVVDANVVVDAFVTGRALTGRLVAPAHLPVEVMSAMARLERAGRVSPQVAGQAMERLAEMPVTLVSAQRLTTIAWAVRHSVSIADAFYLACALLASAPLLTRDQGLARAAQQRGIEVISPQI